jgi:hypothetical protein
MSAYLNSRRDFMKGALAVCGASATLCATATPGSEPDRIAWYRQAKFGMFIHWGPYSQASVEASWPIMVPKPGGITEAAYRELSTAGRKAIYLHLFDWTPPLCTLAGIDARVVSARLLANGAPLKFRQNESKLEIEIPPTAPDPDVSVIALNLF